MAVDDGHCAGVVQGDAVGVVVGCVCGIEVPEIGALHIRMWYTWWYLIYSRVAALTALKAWPKSGTSRI